MKKETRAILWIAIAFVAILLVSFIGKKIYRNQMESEIKTNFMQIDDPEFLPIEAQIKGKTIIYQYEAKMPSVYQNINQNMAQFYQHILVSSCLLNREEIHSGVTLIYQFYYSDKPQERLNQPDFLFMEVPISNETCRLVVF